MTSPEITIRRLQSGDGKLFARLNSVFASSIDDHEHYASAKPTASYLEDLLTRVHIIWVIALSHRGSVVGGLVAYELDIYDIAVAEQFRRQGLATRLIGYLCEIAKDRGADVVYVQADQDDPPAIALYTKLGKREDVLHFDITP